MNQSSNHFPNRNPVIEPMNPRAVLPFPPSFSSEK
ncbi:uncharacterized protein G2W53_015248 [Senna tora]|uniref:Uncharacterized protein n=1 Tax=Senna tora TaxID=362788 RepID=A0A834WV32_9FABA|nr:uncharacterized protein G2W53_015248 [Senna tora]